METKQITGYPPARKVLVKKIETDGKSESGLVFIGDSSVKPNESLVLGVGADIFDLRAGQTVIYSSNNGIEFDLDGENFILLRYEDILLIK